MVVMAIEDPHKKEIFLLLLKTNPARGGFWQNVTGSVEEDESILAGAVRELAEETAIFCKISEIIDLDYSFSFRSQYGEDVEESVFLAIISKRQSIEIDPSEHEAFVWKNAEEVVPANFKFTSNYSAFLKAINFMRGRM